MRRLISDELKPALMSSAFFGIDSIDLEFSINHDAGIIGTVTRHLATALRNIANCLKEHRSIDAAVRLEIGKATKAIDEINHKRQQQRMSFEKIISDASKSNRAGECSKGKNGLDFKAAIGVSSDSFLALSKSDQSSFWDAYWLERDRISISSATLTTLKSSLLNLCLLVDGYMRTKPLGPKASVITLIP